MDAMCNEHEIHIPFVLLIVDSDLKNFPFQLGRKPGGNSHKEVGPGLVFGSRLDCINISDLQNIEKGKVSYIQGDFWVGE